VSRERDRAYLKAPADCVVPLRSGRQLAVLIVTDENHDLLGLCLASVVEHAPELPVYIYENSSNRYPGREELAALHPEVHWVLGPVNLGFAAAVNALVEHTPPNADLLMLGPDTRLRGSLTRTRELLREPGVAAVSPLWCASAGPGPGPTQWDQATHRITLIRALAAVAGYSNALRGTPISRLYTRRPAESHTIDGHPTGACLAINRAAWNAIGGFDEEFFRYGGEADWQARARGAGWRILLADERAVDHGALAISRSVDALGADVDDVAAGEHTRNGDLLRANIALLIEHQQSVHHADAYLAGTALLDRVRRHSRVAAGTRRGRDLPSIVITTNRLVYGGAERQKVLLAGELSRRGYPVTIVCVQRFGPLIREVPRRVRVVRQPWWAPVVDIPAGPAVLISGDTNTETGFATLWRAAGRGRRWLVAPHTPPEEDRPIYSRQLVAAMRRTDGFIALAQRHWEMLGVHHRLDGRHFVAPNGVVPEDGPRRRLRAVDDPLHLVMLSRIAEHKNPHLLVEALNGLTGLPWILSIFGDGPDRERLQARTPAELGDRVHWRGWAAGPGSALANADLLCVPSRSEAFPMAILEAMALAVPVAASAICAVPEMLDFGRAGYVVEPVSVAGWRDQLAHILADPAALPIVGRRGFERMHAHYTVAAMTDAYLAAIGAVL
jgi:glycosyltransferase involved in cell wall biosynthesis/GT2 family glycosyltransferase